MTVTTVDPYAEAFDDYWRAGWRGVLPLPYRRKKTPPDGYTGRAAIEPSYADMSTWAMDGPQNIALHLPPGVIGLDVDAYDGKPGAETLQVLVSQCGALPPTWLSTSRGDGISGIRLFRIPDGVELIGSKPGIEIIQASHRYLVCWPSIHPETGATYEWVDEATGETGTVPPLDELPELPARWLAALERTTAVPDKVDLAPDAITLFLAGLPTGDPCKHILSAAGYAMTKGSRHDAYNGAVLGVIDRGRNGCPGAIAALNRLKSTFVAEVTAPGTTSRRTEPEALAEWGRSLVGAVGISATKTPEQGHGCPDDYLADLIMRDTAPAPQVDAAPEASTPTPEDEREFAYRQQVARKAAELQTLDDAREMLAARKAGQAPPLEALPLGPFLAQPDELVPYRIERLWPVNGRVLLAAAAKAGKTTMVMNLLKALADGGRFLGCYEVTEMAPGRSIVYLNMEVSANQIRRWMRRAGIVNVDRIHVVNLRGVSSALTLGSEQGRARVAEWLRSMNAGMVILDPLAPLLSSLGFDENDNSGVARFFTLWGETLHAGGVDDDLIVHHTGHAGKRSRGAARFLDEPDALWTISKDDALDEDGDDIYEATEPRFFKATGREVEEAEQPLVYDGISGILTLGQGSRKAIRAAANRDTAERRVLAALQEAGDSGLSRKGVEGCGGNKGDNFEAVERLVEQGRVDLKKYPRQHVYTYRPQSPRGPSGDGGHTASPPIYRGTLVPDTGKAVCEDCGGDTGSAGFKICSGCEKRRRTQ